MTSYPIADDEASRLQALRGLEIVGTKGTEAFGIVAQLAANAFVCPISYISLIDEDRQWFKAEYGLGVSSTSRDAAFCNYTILGSKVFVVEDALRDERFASNPFVAGKPRIRFYAGVPIATDTGHRLGALCVCDRRPRHLSADDRERLRRLGRLAEALIDSHEKSNRVATASVEAGERAQLLWKKNRMLQQVERIGRIGGWELDLKTNRVDWSDEISRIHEVPLGTRFGLDEALSFYPDPWRELVVSCIRRAVTSGEPYDFEAQFITALGNKKWVRAAGECELEDGKPVRLFGIFEDITLEKEAQDRMWQAANVDELTGLANRRNFNGALEAAIEHAHASGSRLALMMLDLDNFKHINDTRGHAVGDQVLAEVGQRLARAAPEHSLVARLSGDEFAIIVPDTSSPGQIEACGRQLLASLRDPIRIGITNVYAGASIGVARFPEDAASGDDLLKRADLGLYRAKQVDRGSIRLYSSELSSSFERHAQAVDLMRRALAKRKLVPFYQPKVRLCDGSCTGFEALARVLSEDGALGPAHFWPALQDHQMARRVSERILLAVTADVADWHAAGFGQISVSLNVGESDFAEGKLPKRVFAHLDEFSLPPSCLTIEVTESVFLGEDARLAREALTELHEEGVKIELDDFGTGYASLKHLRAFPISRLKIDQSFIHDLQPEGESRTIVQAVIDLGHNLGLELVAEGVETQDQADLLREMGCDLAQGYLFGKPAGRERTTEYLSSKVASELRKIASSHRLRRSARPSQVQRQPAAGRR
jgi:diguanylate cyclase (GGDEF)-like protein